MSSVGVSIYLSTTGLGYVSGSVLFTAEASSGVSKAYGMRLTLLDTRYRIGSSVPINGT